MSSRNRTRQKRDGELSRSYVTMPGLHIRSPWSQLILGGTKTVETRSYQLPGKYIGELLAIIETFGGARPARIVGFVRFESSFRYTSKGEWEADSARHRVDSVDQDYGYCEDAPKWGWVVAETFALRDVCEPPAKRGIRFVTECRVPKSILPKNLTQLFS